VPIGTSTLELRTKEEVERARTERGVFVPAGYTVFWPMLTEGYEDELAATNATFEHAINQLQTLSKDASIGGGSHNISRKGGLYPAGKSRGKQREADAEVGSHAHGARRRLVCSSAGRPKSSQVSDADALGRDGDGGGDGGGDGDGDDGDGDVAPVRRRARSSCKTDCQHKIWLEHVVGGIAIMELSSFDHNHDLATTRAEKASAAQTRDDIPPAALDEAAIWSAHVPLPLVVSILISKFTVDGKVPDWTIKDFANQLQPAPAEKMLDTTNFVAALTGLGAEGVARACCSRIRARPPACDSHASPAVPHPAHS
jgi:hypothetical protein